MREADAKGESIKEVIFTVNSLWVRVKLIGLRFKELVSGAVASVSA